MFSLQIFFFVEGEGGRKKEQAKLYLAFTKLADSLTNTPHYYLFSSLCSSEGKALCLIHCLAEWLQGFS